MSVPFLGQIGFLNLLGVLGLWVWARALQVSFDLLYHLMRKWRMDINILSIAVVNIF